ncbi:MAG: PAS domain-containing protein [Planctomycetes bacterium]|nr:PAS domain-containing protein [Planctomycetota bacterium]
MKKTYKNSLITGLTAAGICLAWLIVGTLSATDGAQSWLVIQWTLGGLFMLSIGVLSASLWRVSSQQIAARRYFDQLAGTDPQEIFGSGGSDFPVLSQQNPAFETANLLRTTLGEIGGRLDQLEHARASADIRARRQYDDNRRMSTILSALVDPIFTVDHYGDLIYCNESAQQLFGIKFDANEKQPLSALIHSAELVELVSDARRHQGPAERRCELELVDAQSGATRWYRATAQTIVEGADDRSDDGDGAVAEHSTQGAVAVLRDVSNQKGMQKRNAEFVSSVSHEMKTPLASIKAYVELLADGDVEDEETREEFLGVIDGQADRLQRLVENLLNIARIEAGVVQVSKQNRSLNEMLEEAHNVVQPSAERKDISLEVELSSMYLGVHVDRDMFLQAVINLLSNAIKYTPDGGRVTLRSRTHDSRVQVEVEDTGVGLCEEDCRNIFEKFYRVKKDKSMAAGTGLGLPLAKHIVEDVHGGELEVRSTLGKGSTFTITVPAARELSSATPAMSS